MADPSLQVLYVDDEPILIRVAATFMGKCGISISAAISGQEALNKLQSGTYDAVISDYQMPGMDGIALLKEIRLRNIDIPFILFTGKGREEVVIQAIESGADYYVQKGSDIKSQFTDLIHKIQLSVERRKSKIAKAEIDESFRLAFECASDAIFWADVQTGDLVNCNRAAEEMFEMSRTEIIGKHHSILYPPNFSEYSEILFNKAVFSPGPLGEEAVILTSSGAIIPVTISTSVTKLGDRKIIQGIFRDISEHIKDKAELEKSEIRFNSLFDFIATPTWEVDFSQVKSYFRDLHAKGIMSIREYFDEYPEKIRYCMSLLKVTKVNIATLRLFQVQTKEEAVQCMISLFTKESWPVFGEQLIALEEGQTLFEAISPVCDPHGVITSLFLRVTVDPNSVETLSQVYVSYQNIGEKKGEC